MKKVVLSLAAIALLTVVSCKDANAEAQVEEITTEEVVVEEPATEVIVEETATEVPADATEEVIAE